MKQRTLAPPVLAFFSSAAGASAGLSCFCFLLLVALLLAGFLLSAAAADDADAGLPREDERVAALLGTESVASATASDLRLGAISYRLDVT